MAPDATADPGLGRASEARTAALRWRRVVVPVIALIVGAAIALLASSGSGTTTAAVPAHGALRPGAVDVGFSQDMGVHHQQAVAMSRLAEQRGSAPVRSLAGGIMSSQLVEIGWMQGWLALWNQPLVPAGPPMAWMGHAMQSCGTDHGEHAVAGPGAGSCSAHQGMSGGAMPGMATQDEMNRLSRSSGRAFDVLFLQLMTRHHQGGISMASDAEQRATLAPVRDLAARSSRDQLQEIGLMLGMLKRLGAKPLHSR